MTSTEDRSAPPQPYQGQHLGPHPHVAVIFRDQIGDFVVATPLMRGLREQYENLVLDYFGGERTRELEEASPLVNSRFSLFEATASSIALSAYCCERIAAAGPYALAINLESDPAAARACGAAMPRYFVGPCTDPASGRQQPLPSRGIDRLWSDTWNRPDLLADYPELQSQFIGEIFCRLARVKTDFWRTEAPISSPPFATPPILLATGANRGAKLWPVEHWVRLVRWLTVHGHQVGLLGAPAIVQRDFYHSAAVDDAVISAGASDLRGRLTLPEVAGALARAAAFVTVDNGLMHLAAAVGAPSIALFGASPRRIWAPLSPSVQLVEPADPCTLCEENRFRNAECLLPVHQCMRSVEPERVIAHLSALL